MPSSFLLLVHYCEGSTPVLFFYKPFKSLAGKWIESIILDSLWDKPLEWITLKDCPMENLWSVDRRHQKSTPAIALAVHTTPQITECSIQSSTLATIALLYVVCNCPQMGLVAWVTRSWGKILFAVGIDVTGSCRGSKQKHSQCKWKRISTTAVPKHKTALSQRKEEILLLCGRLKLTRF